METTPPQTRRRKSTCDSEGTPAFKRRQVEKEGGYELILKGDIPVPSKLDFTLDLDVVRNAEGFLKKEDNSGYHLFYRVPCYQTQLFLFAMSRHSEGIPIENMAMQGEPASTDKLRRWKQDGVEMSDYLSLKGYLEVVEAFLSIRKTKFNVQKLLSLLVNEEPKSFFNQFKSAMTRQQYDELVMILHMIRYFHLEGLEISRVYKLLKMHLVEDEASQSQLDVILERAYTLLPFAYSNIRERDLVTLAEIQKKRVPTGEPSGRTIPVQVPSTQHGITPETLTLLPTLKTGQVAVPRGSYEFPPLTINGETKTLADFLKENRAVQGLLSLVTRCKKATFEVLSQQANASEDAKLCHEFLAAFLNNLPTGLALPNEIYRLSNTFAKLLPKCRSLLNQHGLQWSHLKMQLGDSWTNWQSFYLHRNLNLLYEIEADFESKLLEECLATLRRNLKDHFKSELNALIRNSRDPKTDRNIQKKSSELLEMLQNKLLGNESISRDDVVPLAQAVLLLHLYYSRIIKAMGNASFEEKAVVLSEFHSDLFTYKSGGESDVRVLTEQMVDDAENLLDQLQYAPIEEHEAEKPSLIEFLKSLSHKLEEEFQRLLKSLIHDYEDPNTEENIHRKVSELVQVLENKIEIENSISSDDLVSFCNSILLFHLFYSKIIKAMGSAPDEEKASVLSEFHSDLFAYKSGGESDIRVLTEQMVDDAEFLLDQLQYTPIEEFEAESAREELSIIEFLKSLGKQLEEEFKCGMESLIQDFQDTKTEERIHKKAAELVQLLQRKLMVGKETINLDDSVPLCEAILSFYFYYSRIVKASKNEEERILDEFFEDLSSYQSGSDTDLLSIVDTMAEEAESILNQLRYPPESTGGKQLFDRPKDIILLPEEEENEALAIRAHFGRSSPQHRITIPRNDEKIRCFGEFLTPLQIVEKFDSILAHNKALLRELKLILVEKIEAFNNFYVDRSLSQKELISVRIWQLITESLPLEEPQEAELVSLLNPFVEKWHFLLEQTNLNVDSIRTEESPMEIVYEGKAPEFREFESLMKPVERPADISLFSGGVDEILREARSCFDRPRTALFEARFVAEPSERSKLEKYLKELRSRFGDLEPRWTALIDDFKRTSLPNPVVKKIEELVRLLHKRLEFDVAVDKSDQYEFCQVVLAFHENYIKLANAVENDSDQMLFDQIVLESELLLRNWRYAPVDLQELDDEEDRARILLEQQNLNPSDEQISQGDREVVFLGERMMPLEMLRQLGSILVHHHDLYREIERIFNLSFTKSSEDLQHLLAVKIWNLITISLRSSIQLEEEIALLLKSSVALWLHLLSNPEAEFENLEFLLTTYSLRRSFNAAIDVQTLLRFYEEVYAKYEGLLEKFAYLKPSATSEDLGNSIFADLISKLGPLETQQKDDLLLSIHQGLQVFLVPESDRSEVEKLQLDMTIILYDLLENLERSRVAAFQTQILQFFDTVRLSLLHWIQDSSLTWMQIEGKVKVKAFFSSIWEIFHCSGRSNSMETFKNHSDAFMIQLDAIMDELEGFINDSYF